MKATSARTTITKICKAGREYAIAEQKAWIAAERENIAAFSSQEAALKAKKEAWIAHKERVEREALEAQERAIRARFTALEGFGFTRRTAMAGGEDLYTNGETTLAIAYVAAATDEVWNNLIKGIEMAWMEQQDRLKAEEEARAAEKERIRLAQEAIEEGARKLKEQQDAFNAKINEARKNELLAVGCEVGIDALGTPIIGAKIPGGFGHAAILADLHTFSDEQWTPIPQRFKEEVEMYAASAKQQQAAADRERLIAERVKALKEAGWDEKSDGQQTTIELSVLETEGTAFFPHTIGEMEDGMFNDLLRMGNAELARRKKVEEDRIAAEAVERERQRVALQAKLDEEARIENEKRAAEAEAERIAEMGDIEHLERFYEALSKLGVEMYNQHLESEMAKHCMKRVLPYLDNAMSAINGVIADLKK